MSWPWRVYHSIPGDCVMLHTPHRITSLTYLPFISTGIIYPKSDREIASPCRSNFSLSTTQCTTREFLSRSHVERSNHNKYHRPSTSDQMMMALIKKFQLLEIFFSLRCSFDCGFRLKWFLYLFTSTVTNSLQYNAVTK